MVNDRSGLRPVTSVVAGRWRSPFTVDCSPFLEVEGSGVDAIAQPGGLGPVLEDVAEVRVAPAAMHLDPAHAVAVVRLDRNALFLRRLPEARPAAARIDLVMGAEQLGAATHAPVASLVVVVPVDAGEGRFRSLLAGNVKLLGRELRPPFLVGLHHFPGGNGRILPATFIAHGLYLRFRFEQLFSNRRAR